jgi:putative effector of murein hydrolase
LLEELLRLQQRSAPSHKLLDALNKVDLAQAIQPLLALKVAAVVVEVTSVVVVAIAMQTSPTAAVVVVPASSTTPVWR